MSRRRESRCRDKGAKPPRQSVDVLDVMTDSLETEAALAAERRRSPRQERTAPAWLSASGRAASGNGIHVTLRDLSLHGAGMICPKALRVGDTHWMVVADLQLRLSTRLKIVTVRPREDGTFDVGGEFY